MVVLRKSEGRILFQLEGVGEARRVDSGDVTVEFGHLEAPLDLTPLFRGLPDDMCQCRHQGYAVRGRLGFKTKEGVINVDEGEAFDIPPGHIFLPEPGCEWVMFSATEEQRKTDEVVQRNVAAGASI
ncbi:MAG TPA: cupin domain-containing protein [Actinomycetota bacterium]|nr:cupin domain-containing protein [Actinomycetota bacterium]